MSKKARGSKANIKSAEPKKASEKKSDKQSEEIKLERPSNKTPQVLKLLEQDKSASNPVILAGKSRIPRQLSGRGPLAIEYQAPEILDRFNACSCDRCVEEFSHIIAERVPVRFARISKASQYRGSPELTERMEPVRKKVLSEMIRELIGNKKRCFHDE